MRGNILDLEKNREFAVFAGNLKFVDTARELHMSQSSLSRHIHELEGEIGVPLVKRGVNGGPNTLTSAGRRFLELTAPWLDQYEAILTECRELSPAVPPARIQDMHCNLNINSQLRTALEAKGISTGNFAYVDIDRPICRALDQGIVDFAVHCDAAPELRWTHEGPIGPAYGWFALAPEHLCFLVGAGNPLTGQGTIGLSDIARTQVITVENAAFCNWPEATTEIFAVHGCPLRFKVVHDNPLSGGAFPIGQSNIVLCTRRFARYYQDLDVEDVDTLEVREFVPTIYPFLVYRKDIESVVARQIIEAFTR